MNERIKELSEIATSYCDTLDVAYSKIYKGIWEREFAELIVKDCLSIISEAVNQREPASTYVDKIKQHFGVE